MRHVRGGLAVCALLSIIGCGSDDAGEPPDLRTQSAKASYGIGYQMGMQLVPARERLDMAAFRIGVNDAMNGQQPAYRK